MTSISKVYRIKRPKQHDDLLNLLKDKDVGVFDTLKSALLFAAAIGFKYKIREQFSDQGEPIAYSLFNESKEQPFVLSLALTEFVDVSYLREEKFLDAVKVFEEYAAGGLKYLDGYLDKQNIKESIEHLISDTEDFDIINDISIW